MFNSATKCRQGVIGTYNQKLAIVSVFNAYNITNIKFVYTFLMLLLLHCVSVSHSHYYYASRFIDAEKNRRDRRAVDGGPRDVVGGLGKHGRRYGGARRLVDRQSRAGRAFRRRFPLPPVTTAPAARTGPDGRRHRRASVCPKRCSECVFVCVRRP